MRFKISLLLFLTIAISFDVAFGSVRCIIERLKANELCDQCTLVDGETMTSDNDLNATKSGTVTLIRYDGKQTLNYFPVGLFDLFPMINEIIIRDANFKQISSKSFKNGTRLWWIMIMDTKSLETIAPDAFNDCINLEYLTLTNSSVTVFDFQFSFPKLRQLVISWNSISAVNRIWYQNLPNVSIFFSHFSDLKVCVNETGLSQSLVYKIPGEPRFEPCFENFERLTLTTTAPPITTQEPTPIECKYQVLRDYGYTCRITINGDLPVGVRIIGTHLLGKTDDDVTGVKFLRSQISRIPSAFFEKFSKLFYLDAANSGLKKADENTLSSCGNLKYLNLDDNDIEIIDESFLNNCTSLETILLENNLINQVSPCNNFLKRQKNLVEVSMMFNICIDDDGYFFDEGLGGIYQQTLVKPLIKCFTNFLDPPLFVAIARRRAKKDQF